MRKFTVVVAAFFFLLTTPFSDAGDKESPESVPGAMTIDGAKAKELFDSGVAFIDVRKDKDFDAGHIPGAIHLELKKVLSEETLSEEVKKDEELVMYCNGPSCMRSSQASEKAVGWGFTKVYYYRLGFPDWKSNGYPVE